MFRLFWRRHSKNDTKYHFFAREHRRNRWYARTIPMESNNSKDVDHSWSVGELIGEVWNRQVFTLLESKNYRNPYKYVEGGKPTVTTRKNACNRETMVKIRLAIIFIIAQVVLTKHTSRRSINIVVEDRAIRYNRNIVTNCLPNIL